MAHRDACSLHVCSDVPVRPGSGFCGIAGKGAGEQSLARGLYARLAEDWLLIADRNFYNWADWCTAADSGAALLWRVKSNLTLPVLELLPDGSYRSVLISPKVTGKARELLKPETASSRRTCAARAGCCAPAARTWSARRSTATCWPTMRSAR